MTQGHFSHLYCLVIFKPQTNCLNFSWKQAYQGKRIRLVLLLCNNGLAYLSDHSELVITRPVPIAATQLCVWALSCSIHLCKANWSWTTQLFTWSVEHETFHARLLFEKKIYPQLCMSSGAKKKKCKHNVSGFFLVTLNLFTSFLHL